MGEGAYIRIQNKSSYAVDMKVVEGKSVDEVGMDAIQGEIAPNEQLPNNGEQPFGDGRRYQYIEGDVRFFFQGDGHFHLEAHPTDGAPKSGLKLLVDSDEWWSEDTSPDRSSPVLLVCDVEDDSDDGKTRIEVRVYDNYESANWMGQLEEEIADVPFNKVAIPGTHDSGTFLFNKDLGAAPDSDLTGTIQNIIGGVDALADVVLGQIYERLCKCQTLTFEEQLQKGIRYFDMRIAHHEETETYHTCHGVYCIEMSDALNQFETFLNEHEKEIIILDFNHLYEMDGHHEKFIDMILESFGDKVARVDKVKPASSVKEYWKRGYQVVICYHNTDMTKNDKYEGFLYHGGYVRSPWPEANTTDDLHTKLTTSSIEKRHSAAFFVLQGILTPDGELIKNQILEAKGISIKNSAPSCNTCFADWITGDHVGSKLKLSRDKLQPI